MEPNSKPEVQKENFWKELLKLAVLSLVIVVPFRLFIMQPFVVEGASMDPTFKNGNYLLVDEVSYHFSDPKRGDVLIFKYPKDPSKYFIKRIIGLPGEIVNIKDGKVTIMSSKFPEGIALDEPYVKWQKADNTTFTLAQGEYFVMGDNRLQSADSRLWGPVPEKNIVGKPFVRVFPPGLYPGEANYSERSEGPINNNNP